MRIRHLTLSVAALFGSAVLAVAQPPAVTVPVIPTAPTAPAAMAAQPQTGMTMVPVAPAPYAQTTPVVVASPHGCATPAPYASADCAPAKRSLFDRLFIGSGTANPVSCGCCASERTFLFGSCRQFYTPGKTCNGTPIEYGCGNGECGPKDRCLHITSFLNR